MASLYKILTVQEWNDFQTKGGSFDGSIMDKRDGFIHLTFAYQSSAIIEKFFKGEHTVVLVHIDSDKLGSENPVKVEANRPGGEKYPHLYGVIPSMAIESHDTIELAHTFNNNPSL